MTQESKRSFWAFMRKVGAFSAGLAAVVAIFWTVIRPAIASEVKAALQSQTKIESIEREALAKELGEHEKSQLVIEQRNNADHTEIKQNQKDLENRVEKRLDRMENTMNTILLEIRDGKARR